MIKVNYPISKKTRKELENEYYKIFKYQESAFNAAKRTLPPSLINFFSTITYKQIIVARIEKLVDIFREFENLNDNEREEIENKFGSIFSYSQSDISRFFEDYNHVFNLKACYYCNMDSVHMYSILGEYDNTLDFIRFASKNDLISVIGLDEDIAENIFRIPNRSTLSLDNLSTNVKIAIENLQGTNIWNGYSCELDFINHASSEDLKIIPQIGKIKASKIISGRPYSLGTLIQYPEAEEAHNILCKIIKNGINKNHFTLDHYIPQSRCSLFARSLYNFVPSCYVCNSKLKKEELLSTLISELHTCCPTYKKYNSTGNLEFSLVQKSVIHIFDYSKKDQRKHFLENFEIDIESSNANNRIVSVLHLRQRYSLYKDKAVYLAYLKEKYSEHTLEEIAKILSHGERRTFTANDIRNDIFNDPLSENDSFSKLYTDIKKQVDIKK